MTSNMATVLTQDITINTKKPVFAPHEKGNHLKEWEIVLNAEKEAVFRRNQAPDCPFNPFTIDQILNPPETLGDSLIRKQKEGKNENYSCRYRRGRTDRRRQCHVSWWKMRGWMQLL